MQLLCGGLTMLLIASAVSSSLRTIAVDKTLPAERVTRLANLHRQGEQKKVLEAAAVLAAETAPQTTVPDCSKAPCVALTFDDGPNPITTPQVLAILEAEHVPATFFVLGSRVAGNEALLQQMHADGDEIGNHSWNHADLTKLPADQIKQQIDQTQAAVTSAGVPAPTLFRPPYGTINQTVRDTVQPLKLALWNEDPKDWAAQSPQEVIAASETAVKPGGVVDLHDIYHVTANALQPLIQSLKSRHYQFVTMSQLMASYPASNEFYGGH